MFITHLPNILTFLRILLVPIIVIQLERQHFQLAFILFALAGITDALDGWIAKHFDCQTKLGALIDPLADKLLIISISIMLTVLNYLPFWFMTLVVFRDLVILSGFIVLSFLHRNVKMQPILSSKINTLLMILLLVNTIAQAAGWYHSAFLQNALIYLTAFFLSLSCVQYVWRWAFKHINEDV